MIIQHLRRLVPKMEVLFITRKKQAFTRVCTSIIVLSPVPLSAIPSASSAMKTLRKQSRGPSWPWTSSQRTYPHGILLWLVVQPKYRSSNKKLPISVCTVWQCGILDNLAPIQAHASWINGILVYFKSTHWKDMACATYSQHLKKLHKRKVVFPVPSQSFS